MLRTPATVLAPELAEATIALIAKDGDGDTFPVCSGVWVGARDIITAAHCATGIARKVAGLAEDTPVEVMGYPLTYINHSECRGLYEDPSTVHRAVVVAFDEAHDLVLLRAGYDAGPHSVVELAPLPSPPVGAELIVVGHTSSMYWTQLPGTVSGYITGIKTFKKQGPFLQLASAAYHGNSGGGVYDMAGRLVGIMSFISPAPGVGFAVHLGTIRKFLGRP